MLSPIFSFQSEPGHILRVEDNPGTEVHVILLKLTESTPSDSYATVEAAEDALLAEAALDHLIPAVHPNTGYLYSVTINAMASRILNSTRRGPGDLILLNSATAARILPLLHSEDTTMDFDNDLPRFLTAGTAVGRWTKLNTKLHNTFSIFVSPTYVPDTLTVCYRGAADTSDPGAASEIDVAGVLLSDGAGCRLVSDPSTVGRQFLAKGSDYARSVMV